MAMTDTRTEAATSAALAPADTAPADQAGFAGWFTTADHKRIGRLYIGTSLSFLVIGGVVALLLAAERTQSGVEIVDGDSFFQLYTAHSEILVWLFLVPFFVGLATFVVPLQIGSPEMAFPRGTATAYWGYLISGALLLGAYAADGGPSGDDATAVGLHLLAFGGVVVALGLGLVCLFTTAMTLRAPGMLLNKVPAFTWSVLVSSGLLLITVPVLLARLIDLFIVQHFGGTYSTASYGNSVGWAFSIPQLYLFALPAAGIAVEVVPVLARNRLRSHGIVLAVLAGLGIVGVGAWAQVPETLDDFFYVVLGIVAVIPALALLGTLADTLRGGRPDFRPVLAMAMGSVVMILLGAIAGGLQVIEGLDLQGTVWEAGQAHLVLVGGAGIGALTGLWWWAPKLFGAKLPDGAGLLSFLAVFAGTLALAIPDLINGLDGVPLREIDFDSTAEGLNGLAAVGAGLVVLGGLLAVLVVLRAAIAGGPSAADPWGGATLEWATTSPPAADNFTVPVPAVLSATPLLDETDETGSV
jgi:cytochrome c oxidase subunit I+III